MKRILPLLTLALLLCGCGSEQPQPTETTAPTEPAVVKLYTPSSLEQQVNGAVRSYAADETFDWMAPISGGVLLASGEECTELAMVSSIDGTIVAVKALPLKLKKDGAWQVTASGFA